MESQTRLNLLFPLPCSDNKMVIPYSRYALGIHVGPFKLCVALFCDFDSIAGRLRNPCANSWAPFANILHIGK